MAVVSRAVVLFGAISILVGHEAVAQGENHWYNQFGDHSFLLGGAVIGGVSDLGAVFYNPGRLARIENPSLFLHTRSFQRVSVSVDGPGSDGGLTDVDYGTSPGFSAGAFTLPFWPGHRWAYSYLTRRNRDASLDLSAFVRGGGSGSFPPGESLSLGVELDSHLVEDWFGLSWSTLLSNTVSVGVSAFGTRLSRAQGVDFDLRASVDGVTTALLGTRRYDVAGWGGLLKAGVAVTRGSLEAGLTVTTPQIQLAGRGGTRFEELVVGVDVTGDGLPDDGSVLDRQDDLDAKLRTPAAVGLGLAWRGSRAVLHLSGEWYSALARHTVLESGPVVDASGRSYGRYRVVTELEPVLNVGAGVEWHFGPSFSAYAGVRSDASPEPDAQEDPTAPGELTTSPLIGDVLHFGGGVSAETEWLVITIGLTYATSDEGRVRPAGLDRVNGDADVVPVTTDTLRLLLGLSVRIGFLGVDDFGT